MPLKVTLRHHQHEARVPRTLKVLCFSAAATQDGALTALSKCCPKLVSLNVALIGHITDRGVSALSRGCRSLQALNVAGAKEVSTQCLFLRQELSHARTSTKSVPGCVVRWADLDTVSLHLGQLIALSRGSRQM